MAWRGIRFYPQKFESVDLAAPIAKPEGPLAVASLKGVASGKAAKVAGTLRSSSKDGDNSAAVDASAKAGADGASVKAVAAAAASGKSAEVEASLSAVADKPTTGSKLKASSVAKAKAEAADDDEAEASAITDAVARGDGLSVVKSQESSESDGDFPTAMSSTYLEAVQADIFSLEDFGIFSKIFDYWD
jgi:hypothetical protein